MDRPTSRDEGAPLPPAVTRAPVDRAAAAPSEAPLPPFVARVRHDAQQRGAEADHSLTTATAAASAPASGANAFSPAEQAEAEGTFPLDAFIVPEDASRVPAGYETEEREAPAPESDTGAPASELADRLERIARQLRAEGVEALAPRLIRGDRFDALLAGLISGYMASRDG